MRRLPVLLILGTLTLFATGYAVGQRTARSKLGKYESSAQITAMDWALVRAEISSMQLHFPTSDGAALPHYHFDSDEGTVTASIIVGNDFLNREPTEKVKKLLRDRAMEAQAHISYYLHEVSDENFAVYYRTVEKGDLITFAEYRNGRLTLH